MLLALARENPVNRAILDRLPALGLGDVVTGPLRPTPRHRNCDLFAEKAASYRSRWPHLALAPPAAAAIFYAPMRGVVAAA